MIYYKRLESGRVAPNLFRGSNLSFKEMRWDEIVMLMEGINLLSKRARDISGVWLGAAISYTLNLWENLTRYTTDGTYPIDNNPVERSVRSVALGCNNWLFINSDTSGEDNAVIMTLLRTCELPGIPPLKWLNEIVPHLLICQSKTDYEKLLPYNYKNFFSE